MRYSAEEKRQIVRELSSGVHHTAYPHKVRTRVVVGRERVRPNEEAVPVDRDVLHACREITNDLELGAQLVAAIHSGSSHDVATLGRVVRDLQWQGPAALRAWVRGAIDTPNPPVAPAVLVEVYRAVRDARQPRARR